MEASAVRRFVKIAGRNASISVENEFWNALREIAGYRDVTLSDLVTVIDSEQRIGTLASAIRVFVLSFYRDRAFAHKTRNGTRQMWATIMTATTRH